MKQDLWYRADKSKVHERVAQMVSAIADQSRSSREDARFFMDLASNGNAAGNDLTYSMSPLGMIGRSSSKMRYNLVQAAVDTAASLIAQNRTVPIYTTSAGDFALARKAETKSRVLQGQFYDLGVFDLASDVFYDGAITHIGAVYGYVDRSSGSPKPCLERVLPNELYVDDSDGRYRTPRSICRVRFVAKEVLSALYPKYEAEIEKSGGPSDIDYGMYYIRQDPGVERVKVIEAWHLSSSKKAKDGRYVMCTDKCTLVDEKWESTRFPFAFYRYANRRIGFWGQGLVERVCPAQIRINELMAVKKACQDLCSNAVFLVEKNSRVEWEDLSNLPGQVIKYQGIAPQMVVWSGTPPDIVAEIESIKAETFQQEGLSQATVGGEREKGLDSGRAQRAVQDIKSARIIGSIKAFESFFLDLTILICDLNDMCAEEDPQYMAKARKRYGRQTYIQQVPWKELNFDDENDTQVTLFPMSALPTTPAAKIQQAEDLIARGFVSRPIAMEVTQFQDLDPFLALETADLDLLMFQIDKMLDNEQELPLENQDLKLAAKIVNSAYLVAYRMKASDEILGRFTDFLAYLEQIVPIPPPAPLPVASMDPGAAAAAQMAMAQGAPPPPAPGMM